MGYNNRCIGKDEHSMKSFVRELLMTLILALVIFFLLQATVQTYVVVGQSMEPNLHNDDLLIVNKIVYRLHAPERGDIVVLYPPDQPRDEPPYIKRIIGKPGDTVEFKGDAVYVNYQKLVEPYVNGIPEYKDHVWQVPENEYFVLGDNRNISSDSRGGWTVPREDIIGKAWVSVWPPDTWGVVADNYAAQQITLIYGWSPLYR
jgi:signal peptidase I